MLSVVFFAQTQTQTWGHGHSEAHVAVWHMFDLLHVDKHVNQGGNCQIPHSCHWHPAFAPSDLPNCKHCTMFRSAGCK